MLCSTVFSLTAVTAVWGADFGDAPEGSLAYPDNCVVGLFPTCTNVGPAGWIEHGQHTAWFGLSADGEADGNGGHCPLFDPNMYNQDECFGDGDAGLLIQPSHTIKGAVGDEFYFTCAGDIFGILGKTCESVFWGTSIDIEVHNHMPAQKIAYVNMLVDWNRDGKWSGMMSCPTGIVYEHVLVNFPIPNPYDGKLSSLIPPPIDIGPTPGYLWARFSITDEVLPPSDWDGSGAFAVGETEDYLLYVRRAEDSTQGCAWQEGDPYKMHWPQLPDQTSTGMDVVMYPNTIADDFLCTESGPIRDIHFWASFADDCLPAGGVESVSFTVDIYEDIPASESTPFSHPGKLLWNDYINPDEYTVNQLPEAPQGWFDPDTGTYQPSGNTAVYQYNFCPDETFVQEEGTIYWLQIKPIYWFQYPSPLVPDFLVGWKTSPTAQHWNDDAVWLDPNLGWLPLQYPQEHVLAGKSVDLAFVISNSGAGLPAQNLKWSQPPLEWDPLAKTPNFCGWDEPAYASRLAGTGDTIWQLVADDFRCFGSMPVTSIHWWGSYLGWQQSVPPPGSPSAWHIAFWNNVSASDLYDYSRPNGPLWQLDIPANAVTEHYAGLDKFPNKPSDTCFQYALQLDPSQFFQQQQYLNHTQDSIFWISITARYEDNEMPTHPWGWKTRPQPWMDDAIRITLHRDVITDNILLVPSAITPIKNHAICDTGAGYDMAFQLDTTASFIKWEQSFTGIRHWPHYENEKSVASAAEISSFSTRAQESVVCQVSDDFECTDPHPIIAVVWWGSYIGYDYTACVCQSVEKLQRPSYFLLSIWTDIPDPEPGDNSTFSQPGQKIWEYRAHTFDEVMVGFDKHPEIPQASPGREPVFRYSTSIPKDKWFSPTTDKVYWFSVVAVYNTSANAMVYPWGWTNHASCYGAEAVVWTSSDLTPGVNSPLKDQTGAGEDMSFILFTDPNEISEPPDQPTSRPATPTRCPPVDTQCPAEETRCPNVISICRPGTPTICPAMHTQCPEETVCPSDPTQCYIVHTLCPGGISVPTECPPVETSCPPEDTRCPIQPSRCIVCIGNTVAESAQLAWTTPYVQESHSCAASLAAKKPKTFCERPCPVVEAECLTLP